MLSTFVANYLKCYLCPRNSRAQGDSNPDYSQTFVFVNDYSAVKEQQQDYQAEPSSDGNKPYPTIALLDGQNQVNAYDEWE